MLPEPAHVRLPPGGVLPLAGRAGVQPQDQRVRGGAQLPVGHPRRLCGQRLVGRGGILRTEQAGLVLDDPDMDRVDLPGAQRGERVRQPSGDGGGEPHPPGGGLRGQAQLKAQLDEGQLIIS